MQIPCGLRIVRHCLGHNIPAFALCLLELRFKNSQRLRQLGVKKSFDRIQMAIRSNSQNLQVPALSVLDSAIASE